MRQVVEHHRELRRSHVYATPHHMDEKAPPPQLDTELGWQKLRSGDTAPYQVTAMRQVVKKHHHGG